MKKVYICSRYHADGTHSLIDNIDRALDGCSFAVNRGYAPIAPHLIYPRILDDTVPEKRQKGLELAKEWIPVCDELWQWGATVSEGMAAEIALARELGIPVKVFNNIGIPYEQWNEEDLK